MVTLIMEALQHELRSSEASSHLRCSVLFPALTNTPFNENNARLAFEGDVKQSEDLPLDMRWFLVLVFGFSLAGCLSCQAFVVAVAHSVCCDGCQFTVRQPGEISPGLRTVRDVPDPRTRRRRTKKKNRTLWQWPLGSGQWKHRAQAAKKASE